MRGRENLDDDGGDRELAAGLLDARRRTPCGTLRAPVTSALSCCVTCGACQADVRCSAVLRRMFDIGLTSTAPHFEKSGKRRGARTPIAGPPAAPDVISAFTCCFTSSWPMRPPGPVPGTPAISTPSSRANRRTDGAAGIVRRARRRRRARRVTPVHRRPRRSAAARAFAMSTTSAGLATGLRRAAGRFGAAAAAPVAARRFGAGGCAACRRLGRAGAATASAAASTVSTTWPTFTLSPALTLDRR